MKPHLFYTSLLANVILFMSFKNNIQISLDIIKSDYFISDFSDIVVDDDFDCIVSAVKTRIRNAEYFLKKLEEMV